MRIENAKEIVRSLRCSPRAKRKILGVVQNNYLIRKGEKLSAPELKQIVDYYKQVFPEEFVEGLIKEY